jgi:4-hydroxy-4-methyl-2-oxoglutarate aldolase
MTAAATIRPARREIPDATLIRIAGVDLPTLGHVVETGFTTGLSWVCGTGRAVGRVVTVKLPTTDSTLLQYLTSLVQPGDFVLVDMCGNRTHAPFGGVLAAAFAASGVVGVAVDGACTDIEGLRESGLIVYSRNLSAMTTRRSPGSLHGEINGAVSIGSVAVVPGMVAFGDENGLLVAESAVILDSLPAAEEIMAGEPGLLAVIGSGARLADAFLPDELLTELREIAQRDGGSTT